jgi:gliding motility-associated-like protein
VAILHPDGTIEYAANFDYVDKLNTGAADSVVYRVCDSGRVPLCDTAVMFISIGPPSFKIYEAVSSNGDGINDYWRIDGIEAEPYNKNYVRVFDRYNNLVFETKDYNNKENSWQGESNHGLVKGALPEGTYFYTLILDNGKVFSGFVFLKRQ